VEITRLLRKSKFHPSIKTKLISVIITIVVILLFVASFASISQMLINQQLRQMTETSIVTNDILNAAQSLPFTVSKYDMIRLKL
jgi:hypothetical protein